jgi:AraC-like DNA-binding protein/quercetin dioxygenase-like cupin family protein
MGQAQIIAKTGTILAFTHAPLSTIGVVVKPFVEAVTPEPGASWAFLDRRLPDGIPFEWHHHPEFELTLTLNSRGHRYIGNDVDAYDDGDLVLIGPDLPHSWHSREALDSALPHVALVSWFSREWVDRLTATLPEMSQVRGMLSRASQGICFGHTARAAAVPRIEAMASATPAARLVLLLDVLNLLCHDDMAMPLANAPRDPTAVLAGDLRMARVLAYLHAHFAERVLVGAVADIACVSTSAFHRMFRRHARMTMVDYVTRLRIGRSCSLLIESSQSIAAIAADVGYTNLSLFNRQFARLKGEAPSRFRSRHRIMLGSPRVPAADLSVAS